MSRVEPAVRALRRKSRRLCPRKRDIQPSHLFDGLEGSECRESTLVDANEVQNVGLAREVLGYAHQRIEDMLCR